MTEPETQLWFVLRHDLPWKFRRQEPIGPYICDFICYPKRLVVEVDGVHHAESVTDPTRDAYLASLGFEALASTSSGQAISLDRGTVSQGEILANCKAIADATDLPVNADLENCGADDPRAAAKMIRLACATANSTCTRGVLSLIPRAWSRARKRQ